MRCSLENCERSRVAGVQDALCRVAGENENGRQKCELNLTDVWEPWMMLEMSFLLTMYGEE